MDDSIEQTNSKLNCNGFFSSANTDISSQTETYLWGNNLDEPTILVQTNQGKLVYKMYFPLKTHTSSCMPEKKFIDQLNFEQTLDDIEKQSSCRGIYQYSIVTKDRSISSYLWQDKNSQDTLTIIFDQDNNKLLEKYYNKAAPTINTCIPLHTNWESITVNDAYEDVKTKMGCDGILTSTQDYNGISNTIREWGQQDNSTLNHATLAFRNNLLVSKTLVFKDALSACIPTFEQLQELKFDSSYEEAQSTMKCSGVLQMLYNASEKEDQEQSLYTWKDFFSKDVNDTEDIPLGAVTHQLLFVGGKLKTKSYVNNVQPYSNCMPTKVRFDQINLREDWNIDKNVNAMGCPAVLSSVSQSATGSQKQYSWGATASTYAYVTVDSDGKIVQKYISFTPSK